MSVSKLTIVANLRDELTVPLRKTIKGLDEAAAAADRGAVSADRQAAAFNRLAKEAGWSQNKLGKWVNEQNRLVSKADRTAMAVSALSLATHEAAEATRRQEKAFRDVVHQAGLKVASDGSVRNALGLFIKKQDVAVLRTMAAAKANKVGAAASSQYSTATADATRKTQAFKDALDLEFKSHGYTRDAQGKLVNVMGEYATVAEVAYMRSLALAAVNNNLTATQHRYGEHVARSSEKVGFFSANAVKAGNAVENLSRAMGASNSTARRLGVRMAEALNPDAASGEATAFMKHLDRIKAHAVGVSEKIKSSLTSALKPAGIAAGAGLAYALHGGMNRINALESADVKLDVQNFDPQQRAAIKDEVDQMVRGTFLSLPQALNTAQGLLGSGVDYGAQFSEYMKYTIDAQSIYSAHDPAQLELVLRQIESKEWLTGEERNQLAELGMPVNEWVAAEMNIPMSEVMDAIENREVSAEVWWKAMGKGVEGGAEKMGNTFYGQWLLFLAAVKRSAQYFEEPLLEPMRRGLNTITDFLDDNEEFFRKLGRAASVGMSEAADTIPQIITALEPLGPSLIRLMDALAPILPQLIQGFATWLDIISPVIIALLELTTILLELTGPVLPILIPLLMGTLTIFRGYKILQKIIPWVAAFFGIMGKGTTTITGTTIAMNAATFAANLLSRSIMMFPGTWLIAAVLAVIAVLGALYDKSELVRGLFDGITDSVRAAAEWMDTLLDKIDDYLSKKLGLENNGSYEDARNVDIRPDWWKNAAEPLERNLGYGRGWGTGEGWLRFLHGADSRDENGNPIGWDAVNHLGTGMDRTNAMTYAEMGMPLDGPADPTALIPLPGPAEQDTGRADGGWTANRQLNVGERGREFITNAWASNQVETNAPGALEFINATGTLPPTGGVNVQANVTINGAEDPEYIRAVVMAAIRDAAREGEREYMNLSVRGAG